MNETDRGKSQRPEVRALAQWPSSVSRGNPTRPFAKRPEPSVGPSKLSAGQFVEIPVVWVVEFAQSFDHQWIDLRVFAAFILVETPFTVVFHSNTVEAFGSVIDKVVASDQMWHAEEVFHFLQLGQWIIHKLVTVDHVNLVL